MTTLTAPPSTGDGLRVRGDQPAWTADQLAALHRLGVAQAGPAALAALLAAVIRTGLDPFTDQIRIVAASDRAGGGGVWAVQTSIDAFRLVASRTAEQAGQRYEYEDTLWCGPDRNWADAWLAPQPPAAAKVTVVRADARHPATAAYTDYAPAPELGRDQQRVREWALRPAVLLARCAEALALRRAFPTELAGLHTDDEPIPGNRTRRSAAEAATVGDTASVVDWALRAAQCTTVGQCRALYRAAARAGAPGWVAVLITDHAHDLLDTLAAAADTAASATEEAGADLEVDSHVEHPGPDSF